MMRVGLGCWWFGMSALLMIASASADEAGALALLQKRFPGQAWGKAGMLQVDIDSDGKPDYVFLRQDASSATVGLVLGGAGHKVVTRSFRIGGQSQADLCEGPASIVVESLDYVPSEEAGTVPGFRQSKIGSSFALQGGECDAFHFYWNTTTNDLAWWRL